VQAILNKDVVSRAPVPEDIWEGLRLTGYFLETRVQWEINRTLPEARAAMIDRLVATGYAKG